VIQRSRIYSGRNTHVAIKPPKFPNTTHVPSAEALEVSDVELMATTALQRGPKEKAPIATMNAAAIDEGVSRVFGRFGVRKLRK
jgi:hypothetical protein